MEHRVSVKCLWQRSHLVHMRVSGKHVSKVTGTKQVGKDAGIQKGRWGRRRGWWGAGEEGGERIVGYILSRNCQFPWVLLTENNITWKTQFLEMMTKAHRMRRKGDGGIKKVLVGLSQCHNCPINHFLCLLWALMLFQVLYISYCFGSLRSFMRKWCLVIKGGNWGTWDYLIKRNKGKIYPDMFFVFDSYSFWRGGRGFKTDFLCVTVPALLEHIL